MAIKKLDDEQLSGVNGGLIVEYTDDEFGTRYVICDDNGKAIDDYLYSDFDEALFMASHHGVGSDVITGGEYLSKFGSEVFV